MVFPSKILEEDCPFSNAKFLMTFSILGDSLPHTTAPSLRSIC